MSYAMTGSYLSSPDQASSVYPDRLIRPLPKRSLRSRLSPEAAETISFPPVLPSTSLPNYTPSGEHGEYLTEHPIPHHSHGDMVDHDHGHEYDHEHDHEHDHDHDHDACHHHDHDDCPHHHHHHLCHHDYDDDDVESVEESSPVARRSKTSRSSPRSSRAARHATYASQVSKPSASGVDGYDAFENTNNKKKRKIPTSGSLNLGHTSLSADLASMGLGTSKDAVDDGAGVGQYYGSGNAAISAGLGVQGAGRGRNSRRMSGRNPLGPSINGSNIKAGSVPYDQVAESKDGKPDQGIISAAIANATALLRKPLGKGPSAGQENGGVLDQQLKPTSSNSQFTFTCESADSKGVTFPEQSLYAAGYAQKVNAMPAPSHTTRQATHGTQTTPNVAPHNNSHLPPPQPGTAPPKPKPRRRRGDVYALAARQRRLQQEYARIHHPATGTTTNSASDSEPWLCEFCEYESIFGEPPVALIRQYEIKDRKERKRLAEKRRLLEKAKLKGRKGKKQTKNAAAAKAAQQPATATSQHAHANATYDQPADEYLDDGYDDDPIALPTPPPALLQPPNKLPAPSTYDSTGTAGRTARAAGDGGGGVR